MGAESHNAPGRRHAGTPAIHNIACISWKVCIVMTVVGVAGVVLVLTKSSSCGLCRCGDQAAAGRSTTAGLKVQHASNILTNDLDHVPGKLVQSPGQQQQQQQQQQASSLLYDADSAKAQQVMQAWADYKSRSSPRFCRGECCWQWQAAQIPYQGNFPTTPGAKDLISSTNFRRMADLVVLNPEDSWENQKRGIDPPVAVLDNFTLPCLQDFTVILTEGHRIHHFVTAILPRIAAKFILITMDGDNILPGDEYLQVLLDERVIHWFTINCGPYKHTKLTCIPIGASIWNMSVDHKPNFEIIADMLQQGYGLSQGLAPAVVRNKPGTPNNTMLVNFNTGNHASRASLMELACNGSWKSFTTCLKLDYARSMAVFYKTMAAHRFVLAPIGASPSSYRLWESLMMGSYPIVDFRDQAESGLLDGLPVLIVKNFTTDVTPELLSNMYQVFSSQSWSYHKLYMGHWYNVIYRHRAGVNKRYRIVYTKRQQQGN